MRLATERLLLREFTLDDVESMYGLESIPEVVRYQTYGPRSREEAAAVVREIVRGQGKGPRRHVELAVLLRTSTLPSPKGEGSYIGRVGSWTEDGTAALWYAFMPEARGRGYATEAVRGLMSLLEATRFTIECDPRNVGSWRLAERLGFTRESFVERAYECKGEWVGSVGYVKTASGF